MNKLIALIVLVISGCLFYWLYNTLDMPGIASVVAFVGIVLTGKFWVSD